MVIASWRVQTQSRHIVCVLQGGRENLVDEVGAASSWMPRMLKVQAELLFEYLIRPHIWELLGTTPDLGTHW